MANRHLSRSIVLKTLYEWDFNNGVTSDPLSVVLARNTEEFASNNNDGEFMDALIGGIIRTKPRLDEVIIKAAPDWPLEKIAGIDRNILRIGLYELLYGDQTGVPPKVAINEAIELGKEYGGESSGRFINGVLGSVYRQLGEPGKEQISKKKTIKEKPFEEMPIEYFEGGIVYSRNYNNEIVIGLVFDVFGRWTVIKEDRIDNNEGEALKQVLQNKLDITSYTVKEKIKGIEYIANDPETGKTRRQVIFFLVEVPYGDYLLKESKGLQEFRWFTLDEIAPLNFYDDLTTVLTSAIQIIKQQEFKK